MERETYIRQFGGTNSAGESIQDPAITDRALLHEFVVSNSEQAFNELVRRHAGLVYSTAWHQTRNHSLAEEISQAVFILLVKKASTIGEKSILAGWFYNATRFASMDAKKIELRRILREQKAASMPAENEPFLDDIAVWPEIERYLHEALDGLNPTDRHAILLRFFEKRTFKEVGTELGTSEDAGRVRVNRALEKLHAFLMFKGVTAIPLLTLTTLIQSQAAVTVSESVNHLTLTTLGTLSRQDNLQPLIVA